MYTDINYKTKKALKEAVARGDKVTYHQPGPFGGNEPRDGTITLEGPHYPQPHRWDATATVRDGVIIEVEGTHAPTLAESEDTRGQRPTGAEICLAVENMDADYLMAMAKSVMFDCSYDGICVFCGAERDGCEPDARFYPCENCGGHSVFSFAELMFYL